MSETMIKARGLSKSYRRGAETLRVLDRLDLEMEKGRFYALMGPSGSGKTTLLNLIGGLDHADEGELLVAGEQLEDKRGADLAAWRASHVGFVFQGFNLIPVLTALQNVELPLSLAPLSRRERRQHAEHALELVGLKDRMHHRPSQLSGGQEQRVAIARAIVTDPTILLADEPTGDLDKRSEEEVLILLKRLNREFKKSIVMVTHDPKAAATATRTVHLEKGELVPA